MEFSEVLRQRRMVRRYTTQSPGPDVTARIVRSALRAPSAGFTQGWAFLVLTTDADRARFWTFAPMPAERAAAAHNAPLIIVPLSNKSAYLDRYTEADKGWTDRDAARWPAPYWDIDTGMAAFAILLTAVDEGLGACFFAIMPEHLRAFAAEFGIPDAYHPIGAITVGYRAPGEPPARFTHRRRDSADVVHDGQWGTPWHGV